MRTLLFAMLLAIVVAVGFSALRAWRSLPRPPPTSTEVVELTPEKRQALERLRAEHKFRPNEIAPWHYVGVETPQEEATANEAVHGVIDAVLARPDGSLPAKIVAALIEGGMKKVALLATEDRDRVQEYMLEIWYLLGLKGSTGLFAYGSAFAIPPGYQEPLPKGWASPTEPRVMD
ncbi:MAG: DUF4844 domain-containing protein [Hyphomicrobiales bacterium]